MKPIYQTGSHFIVKNIIQISVNILFSHEWYAIVVRDKRGPSYLDVIIIDTNIGY